MTHKIAIIVLLLLALPIAADAQSDYTIPKKHRVIQESSKQHVSVPVDAQLPNVTFTSLEDKTFHLNTLIKQGSVVFVFLSAECPVAQRYAMRLKRMDAEFSARHVTFIGVYSNENDSVDDVKAYIARAEYPFPIVKDTDGSLARHLGATMTPQAHLIDMSGILRYRGPIDDNRYETRVKHNYLKDALVAVLNGKPVPVKETPAFGCTIHLPELPVQNQITYSEHIAPILQKNCLTCHHQDGIAPFALADYDNVKTRAVKIAEYTQARLMPPWKPVHGFGEFKNERRLTDTEIDMIAKWVKTGTAAGPATNDKTTPLSSETWTLGKPDWVIDTPEEFAKCHASIVITDNFKKDIYIQGVDFQLEKNKTVRGVTATFGAKIFTMRTDQLDGSHVISIGISPNISEKGLHGVCTPGFAPVLLPEGIGYLLPKEKNIILNIEYHNADHQEHDGLRVGLYFSKTPETAQLRKATLMNRLLKKPRNLNQYNVFSSYDFKSDVYVYGVYPSIDAYKHNMRIVAKTQTDEHIKMLWIKASDFKWQDIYYYQEPIFLPAGSRLVFDLQEDSENQNVRKLSDQKNKKAAKLTCHFLYVLASEYTPD